jgi:glycine/D-amino acid oxidase-like deaminating enzyme
MTSEVCVGGPIDALVIGGGFYGCAIAIYLAKQRQLRKVVLVERGPALMERASYSNQARIHNGYHYPRSYTTAHRSQVNAPRFLRDWPSAVKKDLTKLYAIARKNSKVTSRQFQRFCREIGVTLEPADPSHHQLFEPRLIEDVFVAEEYVFNTTELASCAAEELAQYGVSVLLNTCVTEIHRADGDDLQLELISGQGPSQKMASRYVFNCTYSDLNQLGGEYTGTATLLKHEITEMALMQVPKLLSNLGVTVMDGPFFSMLPFPARGLHTLSHVRYTPHLNWRDQSGIDPYNRLNEYGKETRVDWMVRDVGRYMPAIFDACYVESLFEVKTLLVKNETDDGRPILFEKHSSLPRCFSVLGGKIDNIYDVLEKLDAESIERH